MAILMIIGGLLCLAVAIFLGGIIMWQAHLLACGRWPSHILLGIMGLALIFFFLSVTLLHQAGWLPAVHYPSSPSRCSG